MVSQANKHRIEKTFDVGEWVYVRLRIFRQQSVHHRISHKLAKRFFGPFRISARIGAVAYRLDLPESSRIHPVFHVSLLRPCIGDPSIHRNPLPLLQDEALPLLQPMTILAHRLSNKNGKQTTQILVQWVGCPSEEATWETIEDFAKIYPAFVLSSEAQIESNHVLDLEDKVILQGSGSDTSSKLESANKHNDDIIHDHTPIQIMPTVRRSSRAKKIPAKFKD